MWWSAWMSLDVFFSSQCCDSVNLHAMLLILFYVSAFLSTFSNFLSPFFQNIFVEINQINHCVRAINSVLFICLWCLCPVVAWYSYIPSFRQHEHTQVLFWHVHPVETGMHPYTNIPTIQKCSLKSTKVIQIHTHTHPPSERERGRERMNENEDKVKEIETRTYWNLIVAAPRGTAGDWWSGRCDLSMLRTSSSLESSPQIPQCTVFCLQSRGCNFPLFSFPKDTLTVLQLQVESTTRRFALSLCYSQWKLRRRGELNRKVWIDVWVTHGVRW